MHNLCLVPVEMMKLYRAQISAASQRRNQNTNQINKKSNQINNFTTEVYDETKSGIIYLGRNQEHLSNY